MALHVPGHRLGNKEQTAVEIQVFVVVGLGVFQEGGRLEDPGSVDQVLDVAFFVLHLCDESIDLGLIIEIDRGGLDRAVGGQLGLGLGQASLITGHDPDFPAPAQEPLGGLLAHAAGTADDEGQKCRGRGHSISLLGAI